MGTYGSYVFKLLMDSGNVPAVLLIAGVMALSAVIIILWRANSELHEKVVDLHRELVDKTEEYAEKAMGQSREITQAITALMTVAASTYEDNDNCKND